MTENTQTEELARLVMLERSREMDPCKTVYGYNPQTGEYVGPVAAWLSPLECCYPTPPHTLDVPPSGELPGLHVWRVKSNLSGWEAVVDHRGDVYWTADGETHQITELGVEMPADALMTAPDLSTPIVHDIPALAAAPEPDVEVATSPTFDVTARMYRNKLLRESDVYVTRTLELGRDMTALIAYRQALRDITSSPDWPNVTFPTFNAAF